MADLKSTGPSNMRNPKENRGATTSNPAVLDSSDFAYKGFQDTDFFYAFSVPQSDFPSTLERVWEMTRYAGRESAVVGTNRFAQAPEHWANTHDPAWDVVDYLDLVTVTTNGITIKYSPSASRIFVHLWGF